MATERQENTGLIKYTPHFLGDIILHIFPSINTWIVVGVSLLKENQPIAMNMRNPLTESLSSLIMSCKTPAAHLSTYSRDRYLSPETLSEVGSSDEGPSVSSSSCDAVRLRTHLNESFPSIAYSILKRRGCSFLSLYVHGGHACLRRQSGVLRRRAACT